jgi:peptide/nickel transport system ATP-binding protein
MGVASSLLGRKENNIRAVDGVDLNLNKGDVLALVGESGSGKSTLARLICALEPPSGGRIQFMKNDLSSMKGSSLKELRRQIQMVFQDPYDSLDPRCTVYETISEPLIIQGVPSKECTEQVGKTLEEVELKPYSRFINRYPHELSGGERQRVALARAIVFRPSLIVADEPVSMVDASMKAGIINLMLHLHQSLGTTYLFVTHDLSVARHIADRIAIMYLGKIVEIGPPDQVIKDPRHPYTNMLVSAVPIPDPNERKHRVQAIGEPPSATEIPSGCRFHPRCIHAKDKCRIEEPNIQLIAPKHSTACFYPLE